MGAVNSGFLMQPFTWSCKQIGVIPAEVSLGFLIRVDKTKRGRTVPLRPESSVAESFGPR